MSQKFIPIGSNTPKLTSALKRCGILGVGEWCVLCIRLGSMEVKK